MIQVMIERDYEENINHIEVKGHADYSPHGTDIVCAGISALLQSVAFMLVRRNENFVEVSLAEGEGNIYINYPTKESDLICNVFEVGASAIAEQYPEFVRFETS